MNKGQSVSSILTLKERSNRTPHPKACLTLNTQNQTLWYQDTYMKQIDGIDAEFGKHSKSPGELGSVSAWISLLGGQQFVPPYISTERNPDPSQPTQIDCVSVETKMEDSILVLSFLEPPIDKEFYYPEIYFFTSDGRIDPIIIVRRVPPT